MTSRCRPLPKLRQAILLALGASTAWSGAIAGPALPVPCATGACGANGPGSLVTAGSATAVATQNALTVTQTSNSAVLNWSSFNIGAGGSVTFKQPGASSIALNRIYQGSASQILGNLSSNGQVYLVNLNGFLFGAHSTVNVGGLLVSSLPLAMSDADFAKGILSPLQNDRPVLDSSADPFAVNGIGRGVVLDGNGVPVRDANGNTTPVQVVVQPGAVLTAADQGRLLLAGQSVTNGGTLNAPDGQVILAAGQKVYLQADSDPGLRGLIVEVDQGGTAWNQLTGVLSTPRGNVTMVGLAVNQDGRISATTSVAANGSIRLEAADTATFGGAVGAQTVASSHGGTLTIGATSQLSILPETDSTASAVAAQPQLASTVTLLGEQVYLKGGSIVAPGGALTAIAAADPSPAAANPQGGVSTTADPNARLRIDAGTSIDLAGSEVTLPVSANLVEAQLRSNELADDPAQRNGALKGQTVYVDARQGSPAIANLSGAIAAVPQTVAQRTESGGHAVFESEGDVVLASGATVNVSGGSTTYLGGQMQTSYLVGANGQLYPIATASPLMSYVGVVNPSFAQNFDKWGVQEIVPTPGLSAYQPGYVQGAAAGGVQFVAPTLVLNGVLKGNAVNGIYQRTPATAVAGGQLLIGLPGGAGQSATNPPIDFLAPGVRLSATADPVVVDDATSLPAGLTLALPIADLTGSGFTSTRIYSNFGVTLPAGLPLTLPAGSTLSVNAARIDVLSSITDPGGALSFQSVYNVGAADAARGRPGVDVGSGVTLDVRGQFSNDTTAAGVPALAPTWPNGGSIALGVTAPGALLSIGDQVALRASGGAWLQSNGTVTGGTGGAIAITENAVGGGLDVGAALAVDGFGVNGAAGGSFSLAAPRLEIGAGPGGWTAAQQVDEALVPGGVFRLYAPLFADYGFQKVALTATALVAPGAATGNVLTVDAGTTIDASVSSLVLGADAARHASATNLDGLAAPAALAPYLRPAANVSLAALPPASGGQPTLIGTTTTGDVLIGAGASITTDAGGSILVTSLDSIEVDGTLRAPGGTVTLRIASTSGSYGGYDAGFLPNQRIEVGAGGTLDVAGTFVAQPSSAGLDLGTLYAGGSVSLLADRGAVVTDGGSRIAIGGAGAPLDVLQPNGSYGHELAASAAGSVTARSGEAISLLGTIAAAAGQGNSGPAAGGSLDVELTRAQSWWDPGSGAAKASFATAPMTVELVPAAAGTTATPNGANRAVLGVAGIAGSGLDALRIESSGAVQVDGSWSLALARSLVIDAPVIGAAPGARAALSAPYVAVGFAHADPNAAAASGGSGSISFVGDQIDLVGTTVYQGVSTASFTSSGDLRLIGEASGRGAYTLVGSLAVAGDLTLNAGRIYPVSDTSFAVVATAPAAGAASSVTIGQAGANPGTPLSAGSALAISADRIASTGTLYVPLGTLALNARTSLTLGDGSLTSVSAGGLVIPFGATQYNGTQWIYAPGRGTQTVGGVPAHAVSLQGPSVTISKNATIDLTGGGDLAAFEFVPGSGGTRDALAPGVTPGLYAIVPGTAGHAAPGDPQYSVDPTIAAGETLVWSGGGGLAAGTYPLLPARYALLPGAFLVQLEPNVHSTVPGVVGALGDGTPVVSGYLSYGTTGLHQTPGYTGFAIYPGSYGDALASYTESLASSYFTAQAAAAGAARPLLAADAGALSIFVTSALDASGNVLSAGASGGRGASVAISATDLVVGTAEGPVPADAVTVSGAALSRWQPGSLLLGGTPSSDGSTINVLANSVTIGSGTTLSAGEIVLVAGQAVNVDAGATVESTSAGGAGAATAPPVRSVALTGAGNGNAAFVGVSDLNWLEVSRAAGAPAAGAGTVSIASGATLASRGSLSVDGPGGVQLDGTLTGAGAEWSLASSSIAFVPAGTEADALSISPALLAQLGDAAAVRLASTGAIDLLTPTSLGVRSDGSATLRSLTLQAATLNNLTGSGTALSQFGAQTLTLEGAGGAAVPAVAGAPASTLAMVAGELDLGPGALAINGFGSVRATTSGAVVGQGSGSLAVGGDLTLQTAAVTAAPGAQTAIGASGTLTISAPAVAPAVAPALDLGGALTLTGTDVQVAGVVGTRSGLVSIAASRDVDVAAGAVIRTAGVVVAIGDQQLGTPGGALAISAGRNLTLESGATVDVGGAGSATAGSVTLAAGGTAIVAATLGAGGASGAGGGSFRLDAGSLAPATGGANALDSLARELAAGGFDGSIGVRVRGGDLTLDAGSTLAASVVSLTADAGQVVIGGSVVANSAALRGQVALFGGNGVELRPGATLSADGGGADGRGGTIEIGAGRLVAGPGGGLTGYNNGTIRLDAGSTIAAQGAAGDGTLLLRAPALVASADVGVTVLGSDLRVGRVIVEPVLVFNTASFANPAAPTAADWQQVRSSVGTYMSGAATQIAGRLAPGGGTPLSVDAGVEIVAPGALTLAAGGSGAGATALDLSGWRFDGRPVDLTVRAGGNLTVAGTVGDGFATQNVGGLVQPTLLPGASSSIRLVAGADLSSADPLAVNGPAVGTLTIAAGAVVRTGTGSLDLVAARDLVLDGGAAAYTAGTPAVAAGGTAQNPYAAFPAALGTGTPFGVLLDNTSLVMSFPTGGGDLVARAGEDIVVNTQSSPGGVPNWQLAYGGGSFAPSGAVTPLTVAPSWGVNLAAYNWSFGALGGGDLRLSAGRDALNVSAAAADSLLPQWGGEARYVASGGLALVAGNNVGSAQVFLADGAGSVSAGGALTAVLPSTSPRKGDPNIGAGFYLQDSTLAVSARLGLVVDGIYNPTAFGQPATPPDLGAAYFSYGANSALRLATVTGDVVLGASSYATQTLLGRDLFSTPGSVGENVLPPTVSIVATGGSIRFGQGLDSGQPILYPSPSGQLQLLASGDIAGGSLAMSDAAPGTLPSVSSPSSQTQIGATFFDGAIHAQDSQPALVEAGGTIRGLSLSLPKPGRVIAGQDIVDLSYLGQNLGGADQTLIAAGRDIVYSDTYAGSGIEVGGPGRLDLLAARSVSLGFSNGVVTTGNLLNPNLPTAQGADLSIVTGLGTAPDYTGFLAKIVAPSSTYQHELIAYVESLQGSTGLGYAQAELAFAALGADLQRPLVDRIFFQALQASGREATSTPGAGFAGGFAAIDALFPGSRTGSAGASASAYAGNLTLSFSQIYTLSGGDITLLVPGGLINVGVAIPPPLKAGRSASTLGIVAEGAGNIDIYAKGDVNVNASRVFTLGGGDILIWSDEGSIDAGRGAKSAISAPPPAVLINSNGTVTINFSGAAAGSGIRTIQTDPNVALGNVDLIAPLGTVNAGDAGIGAAGNINIAAQHVLGLDNIQFGGAASGVPAQVSSLGVSLSGVSNAAASSSNAATAAAGAGEERERGAAPLASAALGWLDVFVTGLGEDACRPDDLDCLRRQKHE
jgi:filamentous hemagglutinin